MHSTHARAREQQRQQQESRKVQPHERARSRVQRGRLPAAEVLEVRQRHGRPRRDPGRDAVHQDAGDAVVDAAGEADPVDLDVKPPGQPRRRRRGAEARLPRGDSGQRAVRAPPPGRQPGVDDSRCRRCRCRGGRGCRDAVAKVLKGVKLHVGRGRHTGGDAEDQHVGSGVVDATAEADVVQLHGGSPPETHRVQGGTEARLLRQHLGHALVRTPGARPQLGEEAGGGRARGGGGRGRCRGGRRGGAVADVLQGRQRQVCRRRRRGRHAVDQDIGHHVVGAPVEADAVKLHLRCASETERQGRDTEACVLRGHLWDAVVVALRPCLQPTVGAVSKG
mmetsp:Transcript_20473/g.61711  ORF Transcript_20473/g.61711 Transcript_20473/m.61711 type:complete len:336 (-) Transcript_20473:157-1164(-)